VVKTAQGMGDSGGDDVTDCPECGAEIYIIASRCPKCGHWFVEEDRRAMQAHRRNEASISELTTQLRIVKAGGLILLALLVLFLLIAGVIALLGGAS
jgi:hypothetical protein